LRTTPSLIQTDAYNPSQTSIKLDIQWLNGKSSLATITNKSSFGSLILRTNRHGRVLEKTIAIYVTL
jgi:hypothetical protein